LVWYFNFHPKKRKVWKIFFIHIALGQYNGKVMTEVSLNRFQCILLLSAKNHCTFYPNLQLNGLVKSFLSLRNRDKSIFCIFNALNIIMIHFPSNLRGKLAIFVRDRKMHVNFSNHIYYLWFWNVFSSSKIRMYFPVETFIHIFPPHKNYQFSPSSSQTLTEHHIYTFKLHAFLRSHLDLGILINIIYYLWFWNVFSSSKIRMYFPVETFIHIFPPHKNYQFSPSSSQTLTEHHIYTFKLHALLRSHLDLGIPITIWTICFLELKL